MAAKETRILFDRPRKEGGGKGIRYIGVYGIKSKKTGEIIFRISYYLLGRRIEEAVGAAAGGMTAAAANQIRLDRQGGKEKSNPKTRGLAAREQAKANPVESSPSGPWNFDALWAAWKADPENVGKRGTTREDRRYRAQLKATFGHLEPRNLRPTDTDALRLRLAGTMAKHTTIRVVGLLGRIARWGAAKDLCPGIPFPVQLQGKKLGREPKDNKVPTPEQVTSFIKACKEWPDPQGGNFMLTILHTGMRRGDAQRLKWADVDLERATYTKKDSKTGDVQLRFTPEAVELLSSHPRTPGSPFVFSGKGPDGGFTEKQIGQFPPLIRDAAGLPADIQPCHSFRRLIANDLTSMGASVKEIMLAVGWKDPKMVMRYMTAVDARVGDLLSRRGQLLTETENGTPA